MKKIVAGKWVLSTSDEVGEKIENEVRRELMKKWNNIGLLEGLTGKIKEDVSHLYESNPVQEIREDKCECGETKQQIEEICNKCINKNKK